MSHPLLHAERSAKRWGGTADDYLEIHCWMDSTKAHCPDARHRLLLHNSFGMLLAEQVFGPAIMNSAQRRVFVRDIAAQHILDDLGFIPTVGECLAGLTPEPWMAGARKRVSSLPPFSPEQGVSLGDDRPLSATDGLGAG
ncbi:MAG TPA: hypothetical protein VM165_05765 [Planctomycetaceae bacterium]|nr:hypothetical protein [Planctomycetaceae bacterium]